MTRKNPTSNTKHQTLVLIHGFATDSWVWKEQVKWFKKEYDVITIDLYGHDNKRVKAQCSSVKDDEWYDSTLQPAIKKVLQLRTLNSELRTLIGIGWSLGASVLMAAAVKYPELFKGLVLVGATPCFVQKDGFPWAQSKPLVKRMLKDLENSPKETLSRFFPLNFTEKELAGKEAKEFIKHYSSLVTCHLSLFLSLTALLNLDIRGDIKKIDAKALIIHGDKDIVCPKEAGEYLAKNIKGAALEIFRDTGHAPFLTRAELFNKIVQRFLENL